MPTAPITQTGQEDVYAVPLAEAGYTVFNIYHRGRRVRAEPQDPPDYIGATIDWFDRYLVDK